MVVDGGEGRSLQVARGAAILLPREASPVPSTDGLALRAKARQATAVVLAPGLAALPTTLRPARLATATVAEATGAVVVPTVVPVARPTRRPTT